MNDNVYSGGILWYLVVFIFFTIILMDIKIVISGHVSHGKSTITGHLVQLLDNLSQHEIDSFKHIAQLSGCK